MDLNKLGIIWKEKMDLNMFLDFLKKLYINGQPFEVASFSLFNSIDKIEGVLKDVKEFAEFGGKSLIFVTIQSGSVLSMENAGVVKALEELPLVVSLDPAKLHELTILKGEQVLKPVAERWESNIKRMAKIG